MTEKDEEFTLSPSKTRRMPVPVKTDGLSGKNDPLKGKSPSGFNLSPSNINSMFRCAEIILKAQARCAEIRAMSEAELLRLDKEIEMIQKRTDAYISELQAKGKAMDKAMEQVLWFGSQLKGYPESIQLALISALQEQMKSGHHQ